jgi:membrane dipeptidase
MFPCVVVLLAYLVIAPALYGQRAVTDPDPRLLERVRQLLREVPLIDGHNDLAETIKLRFRSDVTRFDLNVVQDQLPADIPRLRAGQVGGQFWSAFVSTDSMATRTTLRGTLDAIEVIHRVVERYPQVFEFASTADDIVRIHRAGKIASMIGVEGGHSMDNSISALSIFYRLGVRYMTLTHWRTTEWADAATDMPLHGGLTEFGEQVVREMNRLGMFVDLSHVSARTMYDALRVSRAPVIFSHSSARAINAHPRNVPDDVLRLISQNGGVVMVNFVSTFVPPTPVAWRSRTDEAGIQQRFDVLGARGGEPSWWVRRDSLGEVARAESDDSATINRRIADWVARNPPPRGTISDLADHIDHIRKVAGIDHVGLGADYFSGGPSVMTEGMGDVTRYPVLLAELLRRGYSDADVKKVAGLNLLRAMRAMERVARTAQRPSP